MTDPHGAEGADNPPPPPNRDPAEEPRTSWREWFASLRRSNDDSMLAGVAAGLATHLSVPVVLVRAGFVLAAFAGIGIPLYLLAWVLVPTYRGERMIGQSLLRDVVALAAVVIAGLLLLDGLAEVSLLRMAWRIAPWALLLIGLGMVLRRTDPASSTVPGATTPGAQPGGPGGGPGDTDELGPSGIAAPTGGDAPLSGATGMDRPVPGTAAATATRRPLQRPVVGPLTWCAVLVVCGLMGIGLAAGVDLFSPGVIAAGALLLFGAGLVASAFIGRARGLVLPALALALVLGGLGALDLRADTVGASFDRRVSAAEHLPDRLSTGFGASTIDLRRLTLSDDRELRIDHFLGVLEIGLPTGTTTTVEIHTAFGDTEVIRPSLTDATWSDPDLAARWTFDGLPEPGDALEEDVGSGLWWEFFSTRHSPTSVDAVRTSTTRLFDNDSDHTLRIVVHLGVGSLQLYDPHWQGDGQQLEQPVQLCTVGGGSRGVVSDCEEVPAERRVPLCINDADFLVDCREDRPGTVDWPRVAACRGFAGEHQPCEHFGIEAVGVELVSVDPATDDPGDAAEDDFGDGYDDGFGDEDAVGRVGDRSADTIAPLDPVEGTTTVPVTTPPPGEQTPADQNAPGAP